MRAPTKAPLRRDNNKRVVCSHQIMKQLAKVMPQLSYVILHDESGELSTLDYLTLGTITPHDVLKIATHLSKEKHFKIIELYDSSESVEEVSHLFSDQMLEYVPDQFKHLFSKFKFVYDSIQMQERTASEITQQLSFVVDLYKTTLMAVWTYN